MDAFVNSFSDFAKQLMPILGAAALVCVVILLIKLIKIMSNLNTTVDKTNKTIDLVDESIDKIQQPLNTVVKVSNTIDKAHDATVSAVTTAKDFVVKQASDIKDKVADYLDNNDVKKELEDNLDDEGE